MDSFLKAVGATVTVLIVIAGLSLLMAFPTKWLVNYVFTDGVRFALFGAAKIGVWRALWLNCLCGTLFRTTTGSCEGKS